MGRSVLGVPEGRIGCYREVSFSEAGQVLDPEFPRKMKVAKPGRSFDEFGGRDHEFCAFGEFVEATGMRFEPVASQLHVEGHV
jgi:hypothetical protein